MIHRKLLFSTLIFLLPLSSLAQMPRTPWDDPDLQGRWSNATLTPFQRPAALADKEFFTPEEAEAYVIQTLQAGDADLNLEADRASSNIGSYNNAFTDRGNNLVPTLRTSLIVEPANGRVPPLTPEAQAQLESNLEYAQLHPADTPADRFLTERCIVFGGGAAPILPEPYNNNYYIVQTPEYVTIMAELNHEVRIIPLDGRPHFPEQVQQWTGDSRGYWEGDTLIVETRNQQPNRHFYGVQMLNSVMTADFRVIEEFTRTGAEQIRYRATVHDPAIFTEPWTVEIFMHPQEGQLIEFACHEGNYGLSGILSAARANERRALESTGENP
jgi:hypothetical protein